jgi:hypothetical protein
MDSHGVNRIKINEKNAANGLRVDRNPINWARIGTVNTGVGVG